MAGMMMGLARKDEEARNVFRETIQRFPPERCCYYADLAKALLAGKTESLEQMPYPAQDRTEMFYLAGLWCDARGDCERAQELFRLSADEYRGGWWSAYLAKRKLAKGPP
jgi:hypothetical protein